MKTRETIREGIEIIEVHTKNPLDKQLRERGYGGYNEFKRLVGEGLIWSDKYQICFEVVSVAPPDETPTKKKSIYNTEGKKIYSYENTTPEDWKEFIDKMTNTGDLIEITEDLYYHFFECLPPRRMRPVWKEKRWDFAFAEGAETLTYFATDGTKFFCQRDLNGKLSYNG